MTSPDDLESQLTDLAAALDLPAPPPAEVARSVRTRLEAQPEPRARRWSPRRRRPRWQVVTTLAALVVALLVGGTPQGRAAVAEILRFAGIEIRVGGASPAPVGTPPLPGQRTVSLDEARRLVTFPIAVPAGLGEPETVWVSDGRVVSLHWRGIRLDEFDGTLGVVFRKDLGPPYPEQVQGGWWIPRHHGVTYIPRTGGETVRYDRLAGPTLIHQRGRVGLRLEGVDDLGEAQRIIRSLR
ncbi:hypothetical protein [Streptosporangium sp. KLBMP 9127]|nr:hypothetical protein [Streptosporangium sp. KLBMP 9127]